MKVYIANDHRGTKYALALAEHLRALGLEVEHLGTKGEEPVDYPDYAKMLGERVADETKGAGADETGVFGIGICGSGAGICMALNKVKGVRAAVVFNDHIAKFVKMHNNANVICFSADTQEIEDIKRYIGLYLGARFEGGRHEMRVEKIGEMEGRG
jgi:ribose 5-phosphate isomerase B